ncbi:MAG: divergent polysaccharide deacetylase family protein [Pseudomonadota bacterium]
MTLGASKSTIKNRKRLPGKKNKKKRKTRQWQGLPFVLIVLAVCVAAGFYVALKHLSLQKSTPLRLNQPVFEVYNTEENFDARAKELDRLLNDKKKLPEPLISTPTKIDNRPRVAIIVDDLGYDQELALEFLAIDTALTISIFPFGPHKEAIVNAAKKTGRETLLHLPMEPSEYPSIDPGPGALFIGMDKDELLSRLDHDLEQIPSAVGVNNHMGSKFTRDEKYMELILRSLKDKNLFFIDSKTTSKSCVRAVAKRLKARFAERNIFIDHVVKEQFIRAQFKRLINLAKTNGSAIGIAHPHRLTYKLLKEELPTMKKQVRIVAVSELTH